MSKKKKKRKSKQEIYIYIYMYLLCIYIYSIYILLVPLMNRKEVPNSQQPNEPACGQARTLMASDFIWQRL